MNIVRHANTIGREGPWDLRHLLNGWVDRYLYDVGLLYNQIPFEELRDRSNITQVSKDAYRKPDFSDLTRAGLPRPPPPVSPPPLPPATAARHYRPTAPPGPTPDNTHAAPDYLYFRPLPSHDTG